MNVTVRRIEVDDIKSYFDLVQSVIGEEEYLMFSPGELEYEESEEFVKNLLKKGGIMVVAEVDGKIVGWCDIRPGEREKEGHVGTLGMGVHKDYRGHGIGKALLKRAFELAKQKGIEKVQLGVFATNAGAYNLYKKLGFEEEGREKKAAKIRGEYVDHILMGKFL